MTELTKLMRLFGEPGFIGTALQRQEIAKGAEDVERLRAALENCQRECDYCKPIADEALSPTQETKK